MADLKFPAPYFGGKSTVANKVWQALGNPKHYIEPFFGSGAVLLGRPNVGNSETVNDKDGFISNVWRALQHAPDEVAKYCDWPVNHADLSARKRKMLASENNLLENLIADDEYYDAKIAGYWIWAASCWIGSGLTIIGQRPHIAHSGKGVHAIGQIPHIIDSGKGVHAIGQIPHIIDSGKGVHAIGQIPHLANAGKGVHAIGQIEKGSDVRDPYKASLYDWFRRLSERMRYVRVVCGDWTQVCGGNWQDKMGDVGVFFDPPYGVEDRDTSVYHHDSIDVAHDVREWCIERGSKPSYRIVLCGYEEHDELLKHGWRKENWKANGGYENRGKQQKNRVREVIYYSPHCLVHQENLFA